MLFHRPVTDPVYPNTHPLPRERCRELEAFATPGEFEPLVFSIYPLRALETSCSATQIIGANPALLLDTENLDPGRYRLSARLVEEGKTCSELVQELRFLAGPFSRENVSPPLHDR